MQSQWSNGGWILTKLFLMDTLYTYWPPSTAHQQLFLGRFSWKYMVQRAVIHHCYSYQQSRITLVILVTSFWLGWGKKTNILNHFPQNDTSFWSSPKCLSLFSHWLKPDPKGKDFSLFLYFLFTQRLETILLWSTSPAQVIWLVCQDTANMPHPKNNICSSEQEIYH